SKEYRGPKDVAKSIPGLPDGAELYWKTRRACWRTLPAEKPSAVTAWQQGPGSALPASAPASWLTQRDSPTRRPPRATALTQATSRSTIVLVRICDCGLGGAP